MIPIIIWTLKQRRYFILWWTLGAVAFVAILMAVYPSIRNQANQLNATLSQLPDTIRALKSNSSDLLSPVGYLNSQLFYATFPLLFSMMTISMGGSLIGRDEQDKTLELLLVRPVSRSRILAAKAISGLIIIGITGLSSALAIVVLGSLVSLDVAVGRILAATGVCLLLTISFGAIAFALTAAGRFTKRASVGIASLFGLASYLLTSLAGVSDWIKKPSQLLPYHYFSPYDAMKGHISTTFLVYTSSIIVAAAIISWFTFRSRDID